LRHVVDILCSGLASEHADELCVDCLSAIRRQWRPLSRNRESGCLGAHEPRLFDDRRNRGEAFADREHTGEIDSSRRWASREADRPSWPGRVSKVAEIGSSRSWPSLAVQTPCEFSRPCARGLWPVDNTAWLTGR
jgi:hypothetical protein